jgi:hypothetical protein
MAFQRRRFTGFRRKKFGRSFRRSSAHARRVTPRSLYRRFRSRQATRRITRVARRTVITHKKFPWTLSSSAAVSTPGFFPFSPTTNQAWLNLFELIPINQLRTAGDVDSFGNRNYPTVFIKGFKLHLIMTNSSGAGVWFNAPLHFRVTVFSQQQYETYLTTNGLSPYVTSMATPPLPITGSDYLYLGEAANMRMSPRDATWNTKLVRVHMDKHFTLRPTMQPTAAASLSSSANNQALEKVVPIWIPWNKRVTYQSNVFTTATDLGTLQISPPVPKWMNLYFTVSVTCYDALAPSASQLASMALTGVTYFQDA